VEPLDLLWILVAGLRWVAVLFGLLFVIATILSETSLPHWLARMWDFPRLQIIVLALLIAAIYPLLERRSGMDWYDWLVPAAMLGVACRQAAWVWPYAGSRVTDIRVRDKAEDLDSDADDDVIRLLISNVLEENDAYDLWRGVIGQETADIVACAETTQQWVDEIHQLLAETHPHTVHVPQDNYYGMAVWSRLPISDVTVENVVQDDVPSIHMTVELANGRPIRVHVLHPRPPAPQEDDSSSARDAELTVMARRIERAREEDPKQEPDALPTIVCGDMNDVAWSRTTDLFLRVGGLLDPRRGRGLFNTFHAEHWWVRFPLDHFFVDRRFRLVEMRRLDYVGSDHFPVYLAVALEPEAEQDQPRHDVDEDDREEAGELIEQQKEREDDGEESGHLRHDASSEADEDDVKHPVNSP
jgi:endonuclease/exonuclease/phosphatase (EEP) superfamily protein YafD